VRPRRQPGGDGEVRLCSRYLRQQAGVERQAFENSFGKLVLGISGHYDTVAADTSFYGNGTTRTSGGGIGGSVTWYGDNGFYVDGQRQASWLNGDLKSAVVGSIINGNDGFGYSFGAESGKRIGIGNGLSLTPQAQLSYSTVTFDNFIDRFAAATDKSPD
jgi:outer membrane autotransporter protein